MSGQHDTGHVDQATIDCWRTNYGLDKRTPSDAARWWHDNLGGHAPSGCVAALGVALDEIERQSTNAAILAQQVADLTARCENQRQIIAAFDIPLHLVPMHDEQVRLRAEVNALTAERDALQQTLRDEIDENLRLRELGCAKPDENITAMTERVIAERDALRSVATQVLRDMRAQGVLLEWQTLLSGAIAARAQEKPE